MIKLRTFMAPLSFSRPTDDTEDSFTALLDKLSEGWEIEPPVYVMTSPSQRRQVVFRIVLWREGRPSVTTVRDCPQIREFITQRRLRQEPL